MTSLRKKYPNLLLISGTGRNTGKTSLACDLIRQWAESGLSAIKISCHFYPQQYMEVVEDVQGVYQIFRETHLDGGKDSARMMAAGAKEVYYVQATDESVMEAFEKIYAKLPPHSPVLCEAGGLGRHVDPGLHVVMKRHVPLPGDKVIDYQPDAVIEMNGAGYSLSLENFLFENGQWKLRQ